MVYVDYAENRIRHDESTLVARSLPDGAKFHPELGCTTERQSPEEYLAKYGPSVRESLAGRDLQLVCATSVDAIWEHHPQTRWSRIEVMPAKYFVAISFPKAADDSQRASLPGGFRKK